MHGMMAQVQRPQCWTVDAISEVRGYLPLSPLFSGAQAFYPIRLASHLWRLREPQLFALLTSFQHMTLVLPSSSAPVLGPPV